MCLLIWIVFYGELCDPLASCYLHKIMNNEWLKIIVIWQLDISFVQGIWIKQFTIQQILPRKKPLDIEKNINIWGDTKPVPQMCMYVDLIWNERKSLTCFYFNFHCCFVDENVDSIPNSQDRRWQ